MKNFSVSHSTRIKGIAIIMMIFHHLFWSKSFVNGYNVNFWPLTIGRVSQITAFFKICVPLFAIISGYGLLYNYKKIKNKEQFLLQRYFKIMPVFWLIAVLSYVVMQIVNKQFTTIFFKENIYLGIINVAFNLMGLSGLLGTPDFCDNWWYISASFVFIFLVPIFHKIAKKYGWLYLGLSIIILPRIIGIAKFSTVSALPFIFSLYLGMLAEEKNLFVKIYHKKIFSKFNDLLTFILYIIVLLVLYLVNTHLPRDIFWELNFGITPFAFICFANKYIINLPVLGKVLETLGKQSYIMYLIHAFIITSFKPFIYGSNSFIVSALIVIIPSYIISFIINQFLKKIKYQSFFNNIAQKIKVQNLKKL